jgi:hypothetical protein
VPVQLDRAGRLPSLVVEVDRTNQPTNPVRVWTEITGYIRNQGGGLSGRNDEFQRTTPGTLQLLLNNRDDAGVRFETLGVQKAQWVRVRAVWQGTTYPVWQGVIEGLLRQWPSAGRDATLQLTAVDSLKLCRLYDLAGTTFPAQRVDQRIVAILALVGLPVGYSSAVAGFAPSLYWRLGESAGTTAADASGNGRNGTYGAGVTLAQTGLLVGDANTSVLFTNAITSVVTSAYSPFVAGSKRTFVGLANRTATTDADVLFGDASGTTNLRLAAASNDVQFISAFLLTWAGAWPGISQTVHWALTYDDTTFLGELFINGVSQGQKMAVVPLGASTTFQAGLSGASAAPFNGKMDEIAVYEYILTAREVQAIYYTSTIAAAGTLDTDTDTVDAVATPLSPNSFALDQLLALEGSDNGLLIANPDGSMSYQGRHWRYVNAVTSTLTLADDFTGVPYRDNAQYQDDDSRLANVVSVTPLGASTPVTVVDSASQAEYWSRTNPSVDRSLLSSSVSLATSAAQWLLHKYKDPSPRLPTVTVDLMAAQQRSNGYVASLLAAANSQRWTWKRQTASPVNQDVYVEQVSHEIDPRVPSWTVTLQLTPADTESAWILGHTTYGVLDSTTRLAY